MEVTADKMDLSATGLSPRALDAIREEAVFDRYLNKASKNTYHPDKNPQGIVPFGLAENKIALEILRPKLEEIARVSDDERIYSYTKRTGEDDYIATLKKFLEHNLHPLHELDSNMLFGTDGVTVILENLAFALAQPDEYILIICPFYYRLTLDFTERPGVHALPVQQSIKTDQFRPRYALDVPALKEALHKASQEGKIVRAIHVTNPNNPTGDVYTAQELRDLLNFAHEHGLHVIANELYGLSVYDTEVTFTSILSLDHPDPEKVHFTWGISKDFGLSGFRLACMYTRNIGVAEYFRRTAIYIRPPSIAQLRVKLLLQDLEYIDNTFKPEMRRRIVARYTDIQQAVVGCGGRVHPSPATIFRWLDLTKFLQTPDWEGEHQLFLQLFSGGVHLMPGASLGHNVPGWFRMVASMEEHVHNQGMKRIVAVLDSITKERENSNKENKHP